MKDLRERCEKILDELGFMVKPDGSFDDEALPMLEHFARSIRNEALFEAAKLSPRMYGAHSVEITEAIRALKTDADASKC